MVNINMVLDNYKMITIQCKFCTMKCKQEHCIKYTTFIWQKFLAKNIIHRDILTRKHFGRSWKETKFEALQMLK